MSAIKKKKVSYNYIMMMMIHKSFKYIFCYEIRKFSTYTVKKVGKFT